MDFIWIPGSKKKIMLKESLLLFSFLSHTCTLSQTHTHAHTLAQALALS